MKTILQISSEIGVTKQAVAYRMKKPPLSKVLHLFTTEENGVVKINPDGETLIKWAFGVKCTIRESQPKDKTASKTISPKAVNPKITPAEPSTPPIRATPNTPTKPPPINPPKKTIANQKFADLLKHTKR